MSVGAHNPMSALVKRLRKVGVTRTYLREVVLPDWWDDEIADNPAGYVEALMYVSGHLGLEFASLRDPDRRPEFRLVGSCKFKSKAGADASHYDLTRAIATRV